MTGIDVVWGSQHPQAPKYGYWCTTFFEEFFDPDGPHWKLGVNWCQHDTFDTLPTGHGAVVVLPGEYQVEFVNELNVLLSSLPWVLLILTADERSLFDPVWIEHPNCITWCASPHRGKQQFDDRTRFIPFFYPPTTRTAFGRVDEDVARPLRWSFAGQVTHSRRRLAVAALSEVPNGLLTQTPGFAKGLKPADYLRQLALSESAPCPSGTSTLDSFRVYEALEAGAVPILDTHCPIEGGDGAEYWNKLLGGDHPLPMIDQWDDVGRVINDIHDQWPMISFKARAWWQQYKRRFAYNLADDIAELGGPTSDVFPVEVVIDPEHHSTVAELEEIIELFRTNPATALVELTIRFSGNEDANYLNDVIWACNHLWTNTVPVFA